MVIKDLKDFRYWYRNRWKTHPGYVWCFLQSDGENLCFACAKENLGQMIFAIVHNDQGGWKPIGIINASESDDLETCSNCNKVLHNPEE